MFRCFNFTSSTILSPESIMFFHLRRFGLLRLPRSPTTSISPVSYAFTSPPDLNFSGNFRICSRFLHQSSPALKLSPFKLHDIGEGITEVEILKWYVTDGQAVEEFDALCEVQSDKSVVELTSHAKGIVRDIKTDPGHMVKVGTVLCVIETDEPSSEDAAEDGLQLPPKSDNAQDGVGDNTKSSTGIQPEKLSGQDEIRAHESATVAQAEDLSEELERASERQFPPPTSSTSRRKHPLDDADKDEDDHLTATETLFRAHDASMDASGPAKLSGEAAILPSAPRREPQHDTGPVPERRPQAVGDRERAVIKAAPAVRTLALRLGIDLSQVSPSGQGGRVVREDVLAAANTTAGLQNQSAQAKGYNTHTTSNKSEVIEQETTRVEFGRTRKVMYKALSEQAKIPHFGYSHTLDLTALIPYLKSKPFSPSKPSYTASDIPSSLIHEGATISEVDKDVKPTLLTFLIKTLLLALEEHPIMRSRVRHGTDGTEKWLEVSRHGIIGVAVSDPKYGLLTPSLPPLNPSTPIPILTNHLTHLRQTAHRPSSQEGAHLTVSSVGGLGECSGASPILPPGGGLAICAVGRAKWEVEWVKREGGKVFDLGVEDVKSAGLKAVLRVPVGWSADHRVLEGAELISFTETWKKYIEEPWRWMKFSG
ncbi:2-oxoisovalerate dehydrogenase E2 component (dihydrolipoyl transacylase) [Cryptococcus neoformans]|nr:2-oxoisovalerate dehydrogenase E2 component (dihydrolipoyl transacylase) [Cryptococcus neoformans var. grubii]